LVPDPPAADGSLSAAARIPEGASWYDGHFPGAPLLPGLAQLALVETLIRRLLGPQAWIRSLSRVRFRQMLPPGTPLTITVVPRRQGSEFHFKIAAGTEVACNGVATCACQAACAPQA
jgi:3-hydroxymyristoyl/3-hydroxydecanoyl-(acyl carrier protein) dehydratase